MTVPRLFYFTIDLSFVQLFVVLYKNIYTASFFRGARFCSLKLFPVILCCVYVTYSGIQFLQSFSYNKLWFLLILPQNDNAYVYFIDKNIHGNRWFTSSQKF
jgi:hypothetical protein